MKIKNFKSFTEASDGLKYHVENNLDLTDSVYRLGSDAHGDLFEEVKTYWDKNNIILSAKSAWMVKNLQVGKKAKFKNRDGSMIDVVLDTPSRGGDKKYQVYRDSGKKDDEGNIIAKKIQWGDTTGLTVKNGNPKAAASFWARHQCDLQKKMNPDTAGFWACYGPSLFSKQLGLESDEPW